MSALSFFLKRKDTKHQKNNRGGLTLDFYLCECLNHSNITFGMSHAIPLILILEVSIM